MTETRPKWPSRLVVVRHGQSALNVAKDLLDEGAVDSLRALEDVRDVDIDLTELGERQAEQTGLYLASYEPFGACFSSPYRRTLRTAEIIISKLPYGLRVFKDNRMREKEFGTLHALTNEDIAKQFPHEYKARLRDGKYWHRLPGGENYPDVEQRVHDFLDVLHRKHSSKNVLVVTHHVPYVMFCALYNHLDEDGVLALGDVPNCGIQEYVLDTSERQEGRMRLIRFNETAYELAAVSQ